jgi:hypothetical protein
MRSAFLSVPWFLNPKQLSMLQRATTGQQPHDECTELPTESTSVHVCPPYRIQGHPLTIHSNETAPAHLIEENLQLGVCESSQMSHARPLLSRGLIASGFYVVHKASFLQLVSEVRRDYTGKDVVLIKYPNPSSRVQLDAPRNDQPI